MWVYGSKKKEKDETNGEGGVDDFSEKCIHFLERSKKDNRRLSAKEDLFRLFLQSVSTTLRQGVATAP